jgi:hypothetical protein
MDFSLDNYFHRKAHATLIGGQAKNAKKIPVQKTGDI